MRNLARCPAAHFQLAYWRWLSSASITITITSSTRFTGAVPSVQQLRDLRRVLGFSGEKDEGEIQPGLERLDGLLRRAFSSSGNENEGVIQPGPEHSDGEFSPA